MVYEKETNTLNSSKEGLVVKNSGTSPLFLLRDLTVLDEVRKVFHETTGLVVSFYYPSDDVYDFYPQNEKNSYCQAIQSTPEGLARCLKNDGDALLEAKNHGEYRIYTCHAGLVNVVIPLRFKDRDLGAIFTGQIFTRKQTGEDIQKICKELKSLGLEEDAIIKEIAGVKIFAHDKLLLAIQLINFMANYILLEEDEMFLRLEVFRKEQDILRMENERMKLQNDLQQLSILVLSDKVNLHAGLSGPSRQNQQKQAIISRAQEFITKNFMQPLTLSDVSRAVYLSPNYFSTIFKEVAGYNFSVYLNLVRVEEGKRLLRETNLPVKQIVPMVGFEDYNYFNRMFRKVVDIPPAAYRERFSQ